MRSLDTINTFMLPSELKHPAECDRYLARCRHMYASFLRLQGVKNRRTIKAAWEARIAAAEARQAELNQLAII